SSSTASSAPATSSKVLVGMSLVSSLALELPMPNMPPAPVCMREMNQNSTANRINIGSKNDNIDMKIESCVTLVWYVSAPELRTESKISGEVRAGYFAITSSTPSCSSTVM